MNIEKELLEAIIKSNQLGNVEAVALPRRYNGHGRNPALVELNPPRDGTSRKIREATNRVFKILGAYTESYMKDFYKSDLKMTQVNGEDGFAKVGRCINTGPLRNSSSYQEAEEEFTAWDYGERIEGRIDNVVMPIFGLDTILYSLTEQRQPSGSEINRFRYIEKLALLKSENVKVKQIEPETYKLTVDYTLIEAEIEDKDFITKINREMQKNSRNGNQMPYGSKSLRYRPGSSEYAAQVVKEHSAYQRSSKYLSYTRTTRMRESSCETFRIGLTDLVKLDNKRTMKQAMERFGVETEKFHCCIILNSEFAKDWLKVMKLPLGEGDLPQNASDYNHGLSMTDLGNRELFASMYGGNTPDDHDVEHLFNSERINSNPELTPSAMGKLIWFYNSEVGYLDNGNNFCGRLNINTGFGEGGIEHADDFFIGLTPPDDPTVILKPTEGLTPANYRMMQIIMKSDSPHIDRLQSRTLSMYRRSIGNYREFHLRQFCEDVLEGATWKNFMYALNPERHREALTGNIVSMKTTSEKPFGIVDLRHITMKHLGFYSIGPCKSHMTDQRKLGELFEVSERYNGIFEFDIDRPVTLRYRWRNQVVSTQNLKRGRYRVVLRDGPDLQRNKNELVTYFDMIQVLRDVDLIYETDRITLIEDINIEGFTANMGDFKRDLEFMGDVEDIEETTFEQENRLNEL